jgi:hypothetical protein
MSADMGYLAVVLSRAFIRRQQLFILTPAPRRRNVWLLKALGLGVAGSEGGGGFGGHTITVAGSINSLNTRAVTGGRQIRRIAHSSQFLGFFLATVPQAV